MLFIHLLSQTQRLTTYPEREVPGTCRDSCPVRRHLQTGDPVLVAVQDGEALALEGVPDINGVVVVSCEQEAPWQGERERERDKWDIADGSC